MSAGDAAALIVAISSVVGVVLAAFALVALQRMLVTVRLSVEQVRRETLPVVSELHRTVARANQELAQVEELLESARSVSATVDSASRLAYLALANPLIKAMALATGTARAARALRRR